MAASAEQLDLIKEAATTLGLSIDESSPEALQQSANEILRGFVTIANRDPSKPVISNVDVSQGFTPAMGEQLVTMIAETKANPKYQNFVLAMNGPFSLAAIAGFRNAFPDLPSPLLEDPQKFIAMIENGEATLGALAAAASVDLDTQTIAAQAAQKAEQERAAAEAAREARKLEIAAHASHSSDPDLVVASRIVEEALLQLGQSINERTAVFTQDPLMGALVADLSVPLPGQPDYEFDAQSQKSLQGVLQALTGPKGLNLGGDKPWQYTPERGQQIVAAFPAYLETMDIPTRHKTEESLALVGGIQGLVNHMNVLHDRKKINNDKYLLAMPEGQSFALSPMGQKILGWVVGFIAQIMPGAMPIVSQLVEGYTGHTLSELLPNNRGVNEYGHANAHLGPEERLQQAYKDALAQSDNPEQMQARLERAARGIVLMPFGDRERADAYRGLLTNSLDQAREALGGLKPGQPGYEAALEEASQVYAAGMMTGLQDVRAQFGGPKPGALSGGLDPAMEDISFPDSKYNVAHLLQDYDILNEGRARIDREPMIFHDSAGRVFIAGEDIASGTFTVLEIPVEDIRAHIDAVALPDRPAQNTGEGWDELRRQRAMLTDELKAAYPAYAFAMDNYAPFMREGFESPLKLAENAIDMSEMTVAYIERGQQWQDKNARIDAMLTPAYERDLNDPARRIGPGQAYTLERPEGPSRLAGLSPEERRAELMRMNQEVSDRKVWEQGRLSTPDIAETSNGRVMLTYRDAQAAKQIHEIESEIARMQKQADGRPILLEDNPRMAELMERRHHIATNEMYRTIDVTDEMTKFRDTDLKQVGGQRRGESDEQYMNYYDRHSAKLDAAFPKLTEVARSYPNFLNGYALAEYVQGELGEEPKNNRAQARESSAERYDRYVEARRENNGILSDIFNNNTTYRRDAQRHMRAERALEREDREQNHRHRREDERPVFDKVDHETVNEFRENAAMTQRPEAPGMAVARPQDLQLSAP